MKTLSLHTIKTKNVIARFDAIEEAYPDVDDFDPETTHKIERGQLTVFCLRVTISVCGVELATEFLGNCVYENPRDVVRSGYGRDMLSEAVGGVRATLSSFRRLNLKD